MNYEIHNFLTCHVQHDINAFTLSIAVLLVVFSSEMLHGIATKCKISWLIDWHVSMIFVIRNELVVFIKHGGPMYARECANALPNFCENYK